MKLLSSYFKEMKIAARGFYFYIEIFFAVILLVILLVAVNEKSVSKQKEFLYYDMPEAFKEFVIQRQIDKGALKLIEPTEFKMKAIGFEVKNEETGEVETYNFDAEIISLRTYQEYDLDTGELNKTAYIADNEEDMIRLAYQEQKIGATVAVNDQGERSFRYYNQGYETDKFVNLLYILHNKTPDVLAAAVESQEVTKLGDIQTLNNRENLVPVMVVFMGSLMGFFIVMAYIYLDKDEGVIRAFAVTPSSIWKYLLTKTMVIMTTVVVSSSIITIPVMGLQPNYFLFYLLLIISTFAFASLGLFISSFFDTISKAFGALYIIMIAMMIPAFSYYIPSFDPVWLRFFPTYPLLQSMKEIIMINTDLGYVLTYSAVFLGGGVLLFVLANFRFKKTLTV
ncbi:MAG: ABC transporter permease [Spirochaetales bacterium]|nr:ABC transporter permease [Spirochaetales bacterium]